MPSTPRLLLVLACVARILSPGLSLRHSGDSAPTSARHFDADDPGAYTNDDLDPTVRTHGHTDVFFQQDPPQQYVAVSYVIIGPSFLVVVWLLWLSTCVCQHRRQLAALHSKGQTGDVQYGVLVDQDHNPRGSCTFNGNHRGKKEELSNSLP